ncbi:MAG TPA: carbohydrate ABC transporter permease [Candidatus Acetatifactor stercoripullorum]|uniref:Carbohydrate ABC transporter permease n=1 Tax=Candidatus Acetatifactor stercoripullorum TaxID=2838414 RepID=A0A9D1UBA3_9FIRM|nr:carbohydrate ABC transporter permease [uncultured Acetatifactor sp.]HIW80938.1 carbohydrate ABC transporter permease [Candidatus Acetatifactor stercoripullorum]
MSMKRRRKIQNFFRYLILIVVGVGMLYPLVWMVFATFKSNAEIFGSISLLPKEWTFDAYKDLFRMYGGQLNLVKAMLNTMIIVVLKVLFTVVSVTLTAYGFARFEFAGKRFLFPIMISTLFLPQTVLNAPQYIMYNSWGWLDSYLPLVVPCLFAGDTFFIFMLIQFLRGIPRDLEQAAAIDGCNSMQALLLVICPILKPAIISAGLFQFMWSCNDFMGPLIYVNTVSKRPVSVFIKMCMDADAGTAWNRVLAFSLIALLPSLIVFLIAQKSFIEGVSAGSLKG